MKTILQGMMVLLLHKAVMAQSQPMPPGPAQATFTKAQEYFYGIGRPYDPQKAFQLYQEAAKEGHPEAMNVLGNMHAGGVVVPVDIKQAFGWYEKAGAAGSALAYNNLAMFYRRGEKVEQDFAKAAAYYKKGALLNNDFSKNSLAYFYYKGLGVRQSYVNAFNLYKELAEKGDVNAQYFLGLCYRNGYGVTANADLAKQWLQKAAEKNDRQAIHELHAEPLPENYSIISSALQNQVKDLHNYQEKLEAAPSNDIGGTYTGYAIYYDFSKEFVHEIVPLTLELRKNGANYEGIWKEGDSLTAPVKASFINNSLSFDSSSKYIRRNYYSYRDGEPYTFNSAALNIKYFRDSVYLNGDVRFYSILRREPGQPMDIVLARKALPGENPVNDERFKLTSFPNPATTTVKASFTVPRNSKVQLELLTVQGKPLQKVNEKTVLAGTYYYSFNVETLAAGSYIIKITADGKTESKIFVKL
jgi:uncharacterized protein